MERKMLYVNGRKLVARPDKYNNDYYVKEYERDIFTNKWTLQCTFISTKKALNDLMGEN